MEAFPEKHAPSETELQPGQLNAWYIENKKALLEKHGAVPAVIYWDKLVREVCVLPGAENQSEMEFYGTCEDKLEHVDRVLVIVLGNELPCYSRK